MKNGRIWSRQMTCHSINLQHPFIQGATKHFEENLRNSKNAETKLIRKSSEEKWVGKNFHRRKLSLSSFLGKAIWSRKQNFRFEDGTLLGKGYHSNTPRIFSYTIITVHKRWQSRWWNFIHFLPFCFYFCLFRIYVNKWFLFLQVGICKCLKVCESLKDVIHLSDTVHSSESVPQRVEYKIC